ncbi:di-trans,poly-cis-decaprenylcistransferase [Candidatus Gottesmanbacteria bacterium]|nr:di-trans,poly-cis-decaprenylcistransferase [Candidatus Gottesmanbacteria bacterium]
MEKNQLSLPKHVAIIMDGNRRWAKAKGLFEFEGHKKGEERIEPIVDKALELGIPYLTFWAFSTENWKRSKTEVSFLLKLYRENLDKKIDRFHKKNVKIHILGNISLFPKDIQKKTQEWMAKTKDNTRMTVNLALSYGGRDEIVRAINHAMQQYDNVTMEQFQKFLDTAGQPDPDLLIRTGGEMRLSGFLLWQLEYTELYFTKTYWPDFTPERFVEAITDYSTRKRRFGT